MWLATKHILIVIICHHETKTLLDLPFSLKTGTAPAVDWIPIGWAARGGGPAHCEPSSIAAVDVLTNHQKNN